MLLLAKILNKCQGAHSRKYSILSFTCLAYFQVPLKWILSQKSYYCKCIISNASLFGLHSSEICPYSHRILKMSCWRVRNKTSPSFPRLKGVRVQLSAPLTLSLHQKTRVTHWQGTMVTIYSHWKKVVYQWWKKNFQRCYIIIQQFYNRDVKERKTVRWNMDYGTMDRNTDLRTSRVTRRRVSNEE